MTHVFQKEKRKEKRTWQTSPGRRVIQQLRGQNFEHFYEPSRYHPLDILNTFLSHVLRHLTD